MEPADLTVKILQEMGDELRGVNARLYAAAREDAARFDATNARFEVIETTLRDLAQQLAYLRARLDERLTRALAG